MRNKDKDKVKVKDKKNNNSNSISNSTDDDATGTATATAPKDASDLFMQMTSRLQANEVIQEVIKEALEVDWKKWYINDILSEGVNANGGGASLAGDISISLIDR